MTAVTATEVAEEFARLGFRAEILKADGEHTKVDAVCVYQNKFARYPLETVWAPYGESDWTWGSDFQYCASAEFSAQDIVPYVLATLSLEV